MNSPSLQPSDSQPFEVADVAQVLTVTASQSGSRWLMLSGCACFLLTFVLHQHFVIGAAPQLPSETFASAPPIEAPNAEASGGRQALASTAKTDATETIPSAAARTTVANAVGETEGQVSALNAEMLLGADAREQPEAGGVPETAKADTHQPLADALLLPATAAGPSELKLAPAAASTAVQENASMAEMQRLQLELLLQKAEAALARDRLTTPLNDNAVHYYQAMLNIAPNHPVAEAGLLRVASRYAEFYRRLMARGEAAKAQHMILQAKALDPQGLTWSTIDGQMLADQAGARNSQPRAQLSEHKNLPQPAQSSNMQEPSLAQVQEAGVTSVSQSRQTRIAGVVRQARSELDAGRPQAAIALLLPELSKAPTHGELVEVLHRAYLEANRQQDAINLRVTLQGAVPGYRLARMQSGELIQQGKLGEAIDILERNLPSYEQDADYYGLLAGLYYKAQRYKDAEQAYEKLLQLNPNFGNYWLGYAVALDAQGNLKARRAFERATQTLAKQDAAREYALQRLRELGQS